MEIDSLDKIEIESLDKFISRIKEIEQCEEGYVRFYRGQPVDKPLKPNAFRKQCFIDNESEMYNEIVNKKPEEFSNSKCSFDHLVKMQHYYIPTRLLDITTNPLVALYFACCEVPKDSIDEHKPTVYCIDVPIELIKNYNSDSVTILSSLARYDNSSKDNLLTCVKNLELTRSLFVHHFMRYKDKIKLLEYSKLEDFKNLEREILESILLDKDSKQISIDTNDSSRSIVCINNVELILNRIKRDCADYSEESIKDLIYKEIWHIKDLRLLHEVKQDKPYFLDRMHIDTFNTIYCVKPRLDNPRIIKQNGAFLIFPHAQAKLKNPMKITEISIDKLKASSIVDELSIVDVNKESLFNDMDTVSLAIKGKYEKNKIIKHPY